MGQQHQVVDVVIAQHQGVFGECCLRQEGAPQIQIFLAPGRGQRDPESGRGIPIDQKRRLGEKPRRIVGGQLRDPANSDSALQLDQGVDRQCIQRRLVGSAVEKPRVSVVTKILDQQKTAGAVFREYLGGTEPEPAQQLRDGNIRNDILLRRRRIHQHGTSAIAAEAIIAPERRITGQGLRLNPGPTATGEKFGHCRAPRCTASKSLSGSGRTERYRLRRTRSDQASAAIEANRACHPLPASSEASRAPGLSP